MKVSFIRACNREIPDQYSMPPLGIGYLSSYLKKYCWFAETACHQTIDEILQAEPDVLGISAATENFNEAIDIAAKVKQALSIPVIVGGAHISALPQTLPAQFDFGIIGEGEQTLVELIKLLYYQDCPGPVDFAKINGLCFHQNGKVIVNPQRSLISELDVLPYPDRDMLGDRWAIPVNQQVHVITSRGCPYRCRFCASAIIWPRYRYFSRQYVVREMEYLRHKYNPEVIYFFDDLFIANVKQFKEIARLIKARKLHEGLYFRAYARIDLINEELAELLRELNFLYLDFGFEANTTKALQYLNKQNASPELNQQAVDILSRYGISLGANFILGSPVETMEDMEATYEFLERNQDKIDRVSFGALIPLPGTRVWEEALSQGMVTENMDWSRLRTPRNLAQFDRFPFLNSQVNRQDFFALYQSFLNLSHEINLRGEIEYLKRRLALKEQRAAKLKAELNTIKGSRLVRLTWKLKKSLLAGHRP